LWHFCCKWAISQSFCQLIWVRNVLSLGCSCRRLAEWSCYYRKDPTGNGNQYLSHKVMTLYNSLPKCEEYILRGLFLVIGAIWFHYHYPETHASQLYHLVWQNEVLLGNDNLIHSLLWRVLYKIVCKYWLLLKLWPISIIVFYFFSVLYEGCIHIPSSLLIISFSWPHPKSSPVSVSTYSIEEILASVPLFHDSLLIILGLQK
jgi:hypothetical protein